MTNNGTPDDTSGDHLSGIRAPPGANKVQLELWRRIFSSRMRQIQSLSPGNFHSYADIIALDLKTSRFKEVGRGSGQRRVDLAKGHYSAWIISQYPPPKSIAAQDVACHILALFYRSIDERLSCTEKKYGLDVVKRALSSLDKALKDQALGLNHRNNENIHVSHAQSNGKDGYEKDQQKKRSRDDSIAQSNDLLKNKTVPAQNSNESQKEQGEHDIINNANVSDKGDVRSRKEPRAGGENQSQPSTNSKEKEKDNEGGDKEPKNKRQRTEPLLSTEETTYRPQLQIHRNEPATAMIDSATAGLPSGNEKNKSTAATLDTSSQLSSMQNSNEKQNVPMGRDRYHVNNSTNESTSGNKGSVSSDKSSSSQTPPVKNKRVLSEKKQKTQGDSAGDSSTKPPPKKVLPTLPPPLPYYCMRNISFLPDNHSPNLASASLQPRNSPCTLSFDAGFHFDGSGASLDDKTFVDLRERLERWEPYWKVVKEFGRQEVPAEGGRKQTKASTRTTTCVSAIKNIASCAMTYVDLPSECINAKEPNAAPWGLKLGESATSYRTGERRLLLRMLPLKRTAYDKKKSDTHRWPIGTFLQLSRGTNKQAIMIAQRRQQSHDPKLWKGLCHPLDLTTFLKDARYPFSISICTKEAIEKPETQKYKVGTPVSKLFEDEDGEERPFAGTVKRYDTKFKLYQILYEDGDAEELTDDEVAKVLVKKEEAQSLLGSYGIHLAVCEYIGPDDLCVQLMGTMQKISLETSQRMAKRYLEKQTVSMIDSDGEDGNSGGSSSLTFSLLCHLSRKAIDIPVRGKNCKHMQCFDLKSFLHSNSHVSGGRWRCAVCEDFLSVRDLVHCGLFEAMLNDHRDKVSGARDKVSFKPDLTWCMKDANKLRYAGKSRGIGDNEGGDTQVKEQAIEGADVASQKRSVSQPEVIDLS